MITMCPKRTSFSVLLSGVLLIIFVAGDAYALMSVDPGVAIERCSKYTPQQQTSCKACVVAPGVMAKQTMCKDYLHLMDIDALDEAGKQTVKTDSVDVETKITRLKNHCKNLNPSKKIVNCQCWEKEYRNNLSKGINNDDLRKDISSACVATDKIKKYQYASCVTHEGQWKKIVNFKSYCDCVSDFMVVEIKKGWNVGVGPNSLRRPAAKSCGYVRQKKLSAADVKDRFKKYGRRGPQPAF